MIRKLRWKFVIVTMCLITFTFGTIMVADYLYTKYWERESVAATLMYFANNNTSNEEEIKDVVSVDLFYDEIYLITFDKTGELTRRQSSGNSNLKISDKHLELLLASGKDEGRYKSYMYATVKTKDGYRMALTDIMADNSNIHQYIGTILLYACAFCALLMVSILLSRFVIKPAQIALEREKQFISDASHELKTPLSAISINAQALEAELGNNRHLQHIISESKRMDRLIKDLLRLSSLDERYQHMEKHVFDISGCCEEMLLSMESCIFEKDMIFQYDIEEDIYYIGNEAFIKQVIAILLDNAIIHTPKQGHIDVYLRRRGKKIVFAVENTGEHISEEDRIHIFDRFYRIDKSRNSEGNNYGLGLAIAKSIITAHNGNIKVESEPGERVRFTVEL